MTLSPDADKAQVRQAVIELQRQHEELKLTTKEVCEVLRDRLEEAERRIELLSVALKSTLTSAPKPEPRPQWSAEPTVGPREWRPIGDGAKFWAGPDGFTKPLEQVPQEALERFQREKGTPRPEVEPD